MVGSFVPREPFNYGSGVLYVAPQGRPPDAVHVVLTDASVAQIAQSQVLRLIDPPTPDSVTTTSPSPWRSCRSRSLAAWPPSGGRYCSASSAEGRCSSRSSPWPTSSYAAPTSAAAAPSAPPGPPLSPSSCHAPSPRPARRGPRGRCRPDHHRPAQRGPALGLHHRHRNPRPPRGRHRCGPTRPLRRHPRPRPRPQNPVNPTSQTWHVWKYAADGELVPPTQHRRGLLARQGHHRSRHRAPLLTARYAEHRNRGLHGRPNLSLQPSPQQELRRDGLSSMS